MFGLLEQCGFTADQIGEFGASLKHSGQPSVDVFIEHRTDQPEFLEIGRTAIAASLIPYEVEANLYGRDRDWYHYLFQLLGPSLSDIGNSQLGIITFNYDRSLDHFLYVAMRNSFGLPHEDALKFLTSIPLVHVYGKLAELPYLATDDQSFSRKYSPDLNADLAIRTKDAIKIVHKAVPDDPEFTQARSLIGRAELICFLGFGYLETNLIRLGFPGGASGGARIVGSAYGMGDGQKTAVRNFFSDRRPLGLGHGQDVIEFLKDTLIR